LLQFNSLSICIFSNLSVSLLLIERYSCFICKLVVES
jgi:hypothetical protein